MALSAEQEAYLAALADAALRQQAYDAKVAELDAARVAAEAAVAKALKTAVHSTTGAAQKQAILDLQAAIAADPVVSALTAEVEAIKP